MNSRRLLLDASAMPAHSRHRRVLHPSLPAFNMRELAALPQKLRINVASASAGAYHHLGVGNIALETGTTQQHAPYPAARKLGVTLPT